MVQVNILYVTMTLVQFKEIHMTIIQNLINKNYSTNQHFNNIIANGINLTEVDLYLKILDQKAILIESGDLSKKDVQLQLSLEQQAKHLLATINQKLKNISNPNDITNTQISTLAYNLMVSLSNKIDMNAYSENINLHKIYLVSKILSDTYQTQTQPAHNLVINA